MTGFMKLRIKTLKKFLIMIRKQTKKMESKQNPKKLEVGFKEKEEEEEEYIKNY
jgi:hypothetical protein